MKYQHSRHAYEVLDDSRTQMRTIINAAERAGRDLTVSEASKFDALESTAREAIQQYQTLKKTEAQIKQAAHHQRNQAMSMTTNQVLPTNGVLPSDQQAPVFSVNLRQKKLRAFKDERTAYVCGHWMKAFVAQECFGRRDPVSEGICSKAGLEIRNVGTEGSGTAGGYVVPTPLAQTVIDVRESVGVARQLCQIMPMTSDTLSVPKREGGLTVYGGSEAPANDMTPSDKTWGQIELIARKRYVVHQLSQELVDDALIAIVDDAVTEMAYALADAEDLEFILGDGTSTYRGVMGLLAKIGSAGVFTNTAEDVDDWSEFDLQDFADVMGKLPNRFSRDTAWLCSSEFFHSVMLRLAFGAGGNSFATVLREGVERPSFLGRPVYFSPHMPGSTGTSQKSCLYGTFSQAAILGDRTGGPRLARSDDFAFLKDLVTLKATSRYDLNIHEPGDSSNAGAYVALATNS